jgi:acetoin utilization protein AcuB
MKVKDVMSKDPVTIDPAAPLGTAIAVMRSKEIRHLPVVDAGELVGIITDRDLRHAAFAPALGEHLSVRANRRLRAVAENLEDLHIKDAMTWNVTTTHPDTPLLHAALVMFERRVGSLPVVDNGRLVGIVTERDMLKALVSERSLREFDPEGFLW